VNTAPVYSTPTTEQLVALDLGSARRAHRVYLGLKKTAWIGPAHQQCADHAAALRDSALRSARTRLARANGWDQPVSARGAHDPKTPATGEGVLPRVAAGRHLPVLASDDSARLTLQRSTREAIV
jgi:hypothetical protein